jgi:hypothetical protein
MTRVVGLAVWICEKAGGTDEALVETKFCESKETQSIC